MSYLKNAGRVDNCCPTCKPSPCDPCDVCSEVTDLNIVLSGINPCTCVDIGGGQFQTTTFTGFPGAYVVTWDGSQWYLGTGVGTFTRKTWTTDDCSGDPISSVTGALQIVVTCLDGSYSITVDAESTGDVFSGTGLLNVAIDNTDTCVANLAEGGTATLTE